MIKLIPISCSDVDKKKPSHINTKKITIWLQILTNEDEVFIPSVYIILLAVPLWCFSMVISPKYCAKLLSLNFFSLHCIEKFADSDLAQSYCLKKPP